MMGKTGQFNFRGSSIPAFCENYSKDLGRFNSLFAERFIKITNAKKKQGLWVTSLDLVLLLH
jgi:hypothetical protein